MEHPDKASAYGQRSMRSTVTMLKYLARTSSESEINSVLQVNARCGGTLAERRQRIGKLRNEQEQMQAQLQDRVQQLASSLQMDANAKAANVIVSNTADGVSLSNSRNIQLFGNLIGITPASFFGGEAVAGNAGNGVTIAGTSQNVQIASGNRISGNLNGIAIGTGVTSVTVTGNTIGGLLDDGFTAAGNLVDGVAINAAVGNTIGAGNTISRNGRHGVSVVDARAATLTAGNRIFGSTVSDNVSNGIYVGGGSNSTIGGTTAGLGNFIQSNGRSGIYLERSARTGVPTGFAIQGNFVGTNANRDVDAAFGNLSGGIVVNDATGVRIEGNTVMNNLRANDPNNANDPNDGITLRGGSGNVVGGTSAAFANLVAFNDRDGIRVVGASAARAAQRHSIMGNVIVDNGTAGAGNGVTVTGAFARNITIGQSVTTAGVRGLGNVIQRNTASGVAVAGGAQQVSIQGNSISENLGGGIAVAAGSNTSSAAGIALLWKGSGKSRQTNCTRSPYSRRIWSTVGSTREQKGHW
jgi:hypothetical protein